MNPNKPKFIFKAGRMIILKGAKKQPPFYLPVYYFEKTFNYYKNNLTKLNIKIEVKFCDKKKADIYTYTYTSSSRKK